MTLLLDTTVLIDVLRLKGPRRVFIERLLRDGHILATTVVNVAELYAGAYPSEETMIEAFLAELVCYETTFAIGRRAGLLRRSNARQGRTLKLPDMLVAATALEYRLPLLTDNVKDFAIDGLQLFPLA